MSTKDILSSINKIDLQNLDAISNSKSSEYYTQKYNLSTVLISAIWEDNVEYLKRLEKLGLNYQALFAINYENMSFNTVKVLEECVETKAKRCLRFLLSKNIRLESHSLDHGNNLLLRACRHLSPECTDMLLETNIDPTQINTQNQNLLHFLVQSGNLSKEAYSSTAFEGLFKKSFLKIQDELNNNHFCYGSLNNKALSNYLFDKSTNGFSFLSQFINRPDVFEYVNLDKTPKVENIFSWFVKQLSKKDFFLLEKKLSQHLVMRDDLLEPVRAAKNEHAKIYSKAEKIILDNILGSSDTDPAKSNTNKKIKNKI